MKEPVSDRGRPKQKLHFEVAMQDNNQQKEEQVVERNLTLKEYEKELLEKKQALNAVWKADVERKVGLYKDFESIKLVYKKKADDYDVLDKPKKKEMSQHNKAKVDDKHKVVIDRNGFLQPQRRRESKKHPLAADGGIVKAQTETKTETTISIADAVQFPALERD
ncbi:hypothetical protein Pint_30289 [Pistacia integerrima]|uniref:Uncharacterized protein n=1 Tax=Pistacia integerrima TaxID=434235 RepID=A0ACC0X0M0_9ROSI|nr:hypothetical protein Pint_30289 [Pistacia integerrima]